MNNSPKDLKHYTWMQYFDNQEKIAQDKIDAIRRARREYINQHDLNKIQKKILKENFAKVSN